MSGFPRFDARRADRTGSLLPYTDASTAPGKATADCDIVEARCGRSAVFELCSPSGSCRTSPANAGTMAMTCELTAVDAATRLGIRAGHVPAGISAEHHAAGLSSSLANLPALLERQHRGTSRVRLPASAAKSPGSGAGRCAITWKRSERHTTDGKPAARGKRSGTRWGGQPGRSQKSDKTMPPALALTRSSH